MLDDYQRDFIDFMVRCDVLTFGTFMTKSGRETPYFVNAGRYRTGTQMRELARFYAHAIHARLGEDFDLLFGPAYKGIPLAVATAMALAEQHGHDIGFCFDRKETKDHGEGGQLVGCLPKAGDRVVWIEDVTTAGTSIRETMPKLRAAAAIEPCALAVSVDRRERGRGDRSAFAELRESYGIDCFAIVTIDDIIAHLHGREVGGRVVLDDTVLVRMRAYRKRYGVD